MFIGITAALFLATLGARVPLPALRVAIVAELHVCLTYAGLGLSSDFAYTFVDGSPWPRIQPFGNALIATSALITLFYAAAAWTRLTGAHRRQLAAMTVSVVAVSAVTGVAGPGLLMEAMASLWTLPVAILVAWWCSARVLTLQGSLVSGSAGWLQAERATQYQARHDQLTGLLNKDGAAEALQSLLDTNPDSLVVVTTFHFSGLEQVRAAAGSHTADMLLLAIAGHLVSVLPADAEVARTHLRARITRLLTVAASRGEFEVHYQPVMDTTSLARVGVEALVRWRHHGRLHPPAEWIPIAEQEGLMPTIGLHVLRLAARDAPAIGCRSP